MIIKHNLNGLRGSNKLSQNNQKVNLSIEKLSSGMRINQAADDSAGLSISEKMRSQIRGLEKAERNIKDGISLVNTAEGGLGQIVNPHLQRARELAIQAANGTLTPEDRQAIQKEIDNILDSIDNIANHTEFNNKKVLRPPIITTPPSTTSSNADIVFIIDSTGSMSSPISNVKANIDSFISSIESSGINVNLGLVDYKDVNTRELTTTYPMTGDLDTFKSNLNTISVSGGGDFPESGLEGIKGAMSYSFRDDATINFILVTDALVHDDSDGDGGDGQSLFDIDEVANDLKMNGIKLTVVGPVGNSSGVQTQLQRLTGPTGGNYLNINGDFSSQLLDYADDIIADFGETIELDEMVPLYLQVGANVADEYKIELFDARVHKLGIHGIKVDPYEEAVESLQKIDKALELVSSHRSRYGAYQNALEHIFNNVSNAKENQTVAESRIRDADMAKEIMEQTKNSILAQTTQTMLAQANQLPQSVLNLLK